jgi:hypothetical protein
MPTIGKETTPTVFSFGEGVSQPFASQEKPTKSEQNQSQNQQQTPHQYISNLNS